MAQEAICVILGAGGHARVLIDSMLASNAAVPLAVLDADRSRWGQNILNVPILGDDSILAEVAKRGANCFVVGLGSVGDNSSRRRLFELGVSHSLAPLTVVHPSAVCSKWATVGPGCQVFPGSVINAGAVLGANVIVNSGAVIEHDCVLGDHVHIATGAKLSGTVTVGTGAHIGAGAIVRQSISIGDCAVVGAGAVVVRNVLPRVVVVGVPAYTLRVLGQK